MYKNNSDEEDSKEVCKNVSFVFHWAVCNVHEMQGGNQSLGEN
jgi:hypothetical protein